jgi:hypothetical protein
MTNMPAWAVAEAKAKFSQVIERAALPQTITRNDRPPLSSFRLRNGNGKPAAPALWWTSWHSCAGPA